MTAQCTAIKRNGERCTLPSNGQQGLCWAHDPRNAERRRKTASRGGRSKSGREVAVLKEEIKTIISEVKAGAIDRNDANTMFRGYSVVLDFIKVERGVLEVEDLAREIEELRERRPGAS